MCKFWPNSCLFVCIPTIGAHTNFNLGKPAPLKGNFMFAFKQLRAAFFATKSQQSDLECERDQTLKNENLFLKIFI